MRQHFPVLVSNMLTPLAHIISLLFNPVVLLFPVPYLLVVRETGNPVYALKWTIFSLFFLVIIGIFMGYAVRKGYFTDFDVSKREQRPLLFLFIFLICILYFLSLLYLQGPVVLFIILAGILCSVLVFSFLNTRIKASIHLATVSALIFSFSMLYSDVFLLLLILIPIVAWSRIHIKRHTFEETIVGTATGIVITFLFYVLFKIVLGMSVSV